MVVNAKLLGPTTCGFSRDCVALLGVHAMSLKPAVDSLKTWSHLPGAEFQPSTVASSTVSSIFIYIYIYNVISFCVFLCCLKQERKKVSSNVYNIMI